MNLTGSNGLTLPKKIKALEDAGVIVSKSPAQMGVLMKKVSFLFSVLFLQLIQLPGDGGMNSSSLNQGSFV